MQDKTKKKYANITKELLQLFTVLCEDCQLKKRKVRKSLVVKPIVSSDFNSRCQVDLIDMQSQPDGDFRWIMNYQDHLTKYVVLKALRTKCADEVADKIIDVFCVFGAPKILQSDNGREFSNQLVTAVLKKWPQCKMVHGKPRTVSPTFIQVMNIS